MDLKLTVQDHGDHAMIKVEIDLATSPQLQAVLVDLVYRGLHQLIIDLEQVSFWIAPGSGCWSMPGGASKSTAGP